MQRISESENMPPLKDHVHDVDVAFAMSGRKKVVIKLND
jgi:hypothetical protein